MSPRELEKREKWALALMAAVFAVFAILMYPTLFQDQGQQRGAASLKKIEHQRDMFMAELKEYQEIRGPVEEIDKKLEKTPPDYDLDGALIEMANSLGIQLKSVKEHDAGGTDFYTEIYVDMDMKEVSLDDLVALLKKIEAAPAFLRVSQLSVKRRFSDDRTLDVTARVAAYAKKSEESP